MIIIQKKDFNLEKEINKIKSKYLNVGAVSNFVGYVKDLNNNRKVSSIVLDVYQDMPYNSLKNICQKAKKKWDIIDVLIIHRFGKLDINEKIVLVATFSTHRKASFESCNYIMNYLKKDAPFWKKELYKNGYKWLKNSKKRN